MAYMVAVDHIRDRSIKRNVLCEDVPAAVPHKRMVYGVSIMELRGCCVSSDARQGDSVSPNHPSIPLLLRFLFPIPFSHPSNHPLTPCCPHAPNQEVWRLPYREKRERERGKNSRSARGAGASGTRSGKAAGTREPCSGGRGDCCACAAGQLFPALLSIDLDLYGGWRGKIWLPPSNSPRAAAIENLKAPSSEADHEKRANWLLTPS
jgi:hypothetical protein